MNKVNVCVIAGCLALTFAAPVGAKSLQVQPIGDRLSPIEHARTPIGDSITLLKDGWTSFGSHYTPIGD